MKTLLLLTHLLKCYHHQEVPYQAQKFNHQFQVCSFHLHLQLCKFSTISVDVNMQIANLLCCSSSWITTRFYKTQSQIGSSDCGVFAIAFATDLAFGLNPASHHYEQDKLRPHFITCLKSEQMTPFLSNNIQPGKPKTEYLYVYCHCCMPHDGEDGSVHWLQGMVPRVM